MPENMPDILFYRIHSDETTGSAILSCSCTECCVFLAMCRDALSDCQSSSLNSCRGRELGVGKKNPIPS